MELTALGERGLDLAAPFADDDGRLAWVVGNTRALWPRFKAWLAGHEDGVADPIETYVEEMMAGVPGRVAYAHRGPPWIPIQRLAVRAGLAWLSPANLAIHPVYGPWISLRAVVYTDERFVGAPALAAPACAGCAAGCAPAFARASATLDARDRGASARASWRAWLAVRDACPIGREHRFQDDHIAYGYTKDRAALALGAR